MKKNYIQYKISGLNGLTIDDNNKYCIKNDLIKNILLDENLEHLTLEFNDNISYKEHKHKIDLYATELLFNLILKTEVEFKQPNIFLEILDEDDCIHINESLSIRETLKIERHFNAEKIYSDIIDPQKGFENHRILYNRILGILQNPNYVIQFMSLYEILLELLKKPCDKKAYQANITNYIKQHTPKYSFISFKESTLKNGKYEDSITYLRNEIGHCEETDDIETYKRLGSQINSFTIKNILIVINDVINEL